MPIEFVCVNCQATYEVSNDMAGKAVKCRECGARSRVTPDPEPPRRRPPVRATRADEPSADVVVRLADFAYQVVCFIVALGATGCAMLLIVGLLEGRAVEVFVVVVLAVVQMVFAVVGVKLVLHLTRVFVGMAKDVGMVKDKLCRERSV